MALRADPTGAYPEGILVAAPARRAARRSLTLRREARLAYLILSPTLIVVVGLANYAELFRSEVFLRTAWNSLVYTGVAVALKFVIGLTMAFVLDQERRFNNLFRTLLFVPWAVPVVIAALNWRWIYDDLSGFLNNFLITVGLTRDIISWLADPRLAMGCVIAVVVWQGTPFYTMTFLAGLQAIPREL